MARYIPKKDAAYTLQHMYKEYIKQFDKDSVYHIPYKLYKDITVDFLKHLRDDVVEKSLIVTLPFSCGKVAVLKKKKNYKSIKAMPIDWKKSKEEGKQVRYFNDHSGGFFYSFYWYKKFCNIRNKNNYLFQPARVNSRRVAKLVKDKVNDYFERL